MAESFIEKFAQKLRMIPNLDRDYSDGNTQELRKFPSPDEWLDFKELDANAVSYTHLTLPTTPYV